MPDRSPVFYTDTGKGFPVVLLHGFCETQAVWHSFAPKLAPHYRVITIDLPGFGQSKRLADGFSISDVAASILSLLSKLGITQCVTIGHSLGGYVTLEMVHQQPGMFNGFGLFHSSAYADTDERKVSRNKVIEFVSKNGVEAFIETFIPPLFFDKENPHIPFAVKMALQTTPETLTGYAKAMRDRPDRTSVIKKSLNPVLFIAGENDTVVTPEALRQQAMLAQKPALHLVKGVAHMGMFENEVETVAITQHFLAKTVV